MLLVAICPVQSLFERMRIRAMSEQDYSWVDDLIGSMEDEFNPSTKVNADQLEDGSYVFKVENMELEKIESTGTPIVRWTLKVLEGPSCVDSIVERTSYFGKPVALNILGSDLTLLGSCQGIGRRTTFHLQSCLSVRLARPLERSSMVANELMPISRLARPITI